MEPLFTYSSDSQGAAQEARKKRAEERQREHLARVEESIRAKELRKAERKVKHAEVLRGHEQNREIKEENRQKQTKLVEEKHEKHTRELIGTIDRKSLVEAFSQSLGKYGQIEDVSIVKQIPSKSTDWQINVVFKKKEDATKARSQTLNFPTTVQLEPRPIPDWSIYFPFLWMPEGVDRSEFRPSGKNWDELKKEIARVFTSKIPGSKIHVISYRQASVVVCFDSRESQLKAFEVAPHTPLIVGGKQIPTLVQGLPKPPGQKRKSGQTEQKNEEPVSNGTAAMVTSDVSSAQPMKIARK